MTAAFRVLSIPDQERQLHGVLELRDVPDVEALVYGAVRDAARLYYGRQLEPSDFDDTVRHVLGDVVIEERRFLRRGLDRKPGIVFRAWLYTQLRSRSIDYWRSYRGRHGQHNVYDPRGNHAARTDAAAAAGYRRDHDELPVDVGAGFDPRLDAAAGGDAADRLDALRWLHPEGDREAAGPERVVGGGTGAGAAGRDRGAGAGAGRGAAGRTGRAPAFADCVACGWRSYAIAPNGKPGWTLPETCAACGARLTVAA